MTVNDLIKTLEEFDPDSNVEIVFNTGNPLWAQSIGVGDVAVRDNTVYIIENNWENAAWASELFNEDE